MESESATPLDTIEKVLSDLPGLKPHPLPSPAPRPNANRAESANRARPNRSGFDAGDGQDDTLRLSQRFSAPAEHRHGRECREVEPYAQSRCASRLPSDSEPARPRFDARHAVGHLARNELDAAPRGFVIEEDPRHGEQIVAREFGPGGSPQAGS